MPYKNIAKKREYQKKYCQINKEKIKAQKKKYCQEHKEEAREHNRKYRLENKEKINEYKRKYYQEHKEEQREERREWRTKYNWNKALLKFDGFCQFDGCEIDDRYMLTTHHLFPNDKEIVVLLCANHHHLIDHYREGFYPEGILYRM